MTDESDAGGPGADDSDATETDADGPDPNGLASGDGPDRSAPGEAGVRAEVHANAWQETLEDMWALEEDLQEEGWDTIATAAGTTGPVAPDHEKGYWGLVHVVPDSDGAAIEDALEDATVNAYDVYRNAVEGRLFGVVVLYTPDADAAVLIAHQYPLRDATALVAHAREVDSVNTVIRFLDDTVIAQVTHGDPEKFFPRYDDFDSFQGEWAASPGEDDGGR